MLTGDLFAISSANCGAGIGRDRGRIGNMRGVAAASGGNAVALVDRRNCRRGPQGSRPRCPAGRIGSGGTPALPTTSEGPPCSTPRRRSAPCSALCCSSLCALCVRSWSSAQAATIGEQKTAVILVNFQDGANPAHQRPPPRIAWCSVRSAISTGRRCTRRPSSVATPSVGSRSRSAKTSCDRNLIAQEADKAGHRRGRQPGHLRAPGLPVPWENACRRLGLQLRRGEPANPAPGSRTTNQCAGLSRTNWATTSGCCIAEAWIAAHPCLGTGCAVTSYGDPADTMGHGSADAFQRVPERTAGLVERGRTATDRDGGHQRQLLGSRPYENAGWHGQGAQDRQGAWIPPPGR